MKKDKKRNLLFTLIKVVLAFLGFTVLINMILEKSIVGGIETFIDKFKTFPFLYIFPIIGVILGVFIGQKINKERKE